MTQQSQHHIPPAVMTKKLQCFLSIFLFSWARLRSTIENEIDLKMYLCPKFHQENKAGSVYGLDPFGLSASLKGQN